MTYWTESTQAMSEYQDLLKRIAEEKDVSPALIQQAMDKIAWHESFNSTLGRGIIPDRVQDGSKIGRGAFQYEKGGAEDSAAVALRRLKNYYTGNKLPIPSWAAELDNTFDPAELTLDQQRMLFLTDHRERTGSDFKKLEEMSIADWWGKYHQTESDPEKIKVFKKHEKLFDTYQNEDLMGLGDIDIEEVQPSELQATPGFFDRLFNIFR
jgi:hypothetical protein